MAGLGDPQGHSTSEVFRAREFIAPLNLRVRLLEAGAAGDSNIGHSTDCATATPAIIGRTSKDGPLKWVIKIRA